jgi:dTMP kinase
MFITFEGIDFSGKSTQVVLLKHYFTKIKKKVKIIREPGGTVISEKIRETLLDKKNNKMCIETEILLFSASRAQLVREKISPYLEKGIYVISDRFHDSTTAYQGYGRGIPLETVMHINRLAIGDTIPDITFFIDISVEEAEKRKSAQRLLELDRIEMSKEYFYNNVRNGYIELAKNEKRIKIINGHLPVETIHKNIIDEIEKIERKEMIL